MEYLALVEQRGFDKVDLQRQLAKESPAKEFSGTSLAKEVWQRKYPASVSRSVTDN